MPGARKLTPAEMAEVEDLPAETAPRKLTAAELAEVQDIPDEQVASASGRPSDVPAQAETPKAPREPGFFERAANQVGEGVGHIGAVALAQGQRLLDAVTSPIQSAKVNWSPQGLAQHGAERRELLRGVDDVTTLGHGQRLAARIGNAAGDVERGTSLNETRRFSADPNQGSTGGQSQVEAADQARAPDVRPAAQLVSSFALPNPVAEGVSLAGRGAAAVATKAAPQAMAKVLRLGQKVPAPVKGLAGYESTAPLAAAGSADAEGHRLEAAKAGASDPLGTSLSVLGTGLGSLAKKGVLDSAGGRARRLIEERGNGAEVGLTTPGRGGVFDAELAGVPANDRGIGIAGKRGANAIIDNLEQAHETGQGYGYREGPALERQAAQDVKDTNRGAARDVRDAGRDTYAEIQRAERDAREFATEQAPTLLSGLDERHRVEGSEPYAAMLEQINSSPAANEKVDLTDVVKLLKASLRDLGTSHEARGKLREDLQLLEPYSDAPPAVAPQPPSPHLAGLLEARRSASGIAADQLDTLIAAEVAATAPPPSQAPIRYLVPHRQVNALRRNVMGQANIGKTDAPSGNDAPLRAAAHALKDIVDQGPYAPLNELYAGASSDREASRESLGLKGRLGNDRAVEERKLKGLMVRSVNDPTVLPSTAPPEASMAPYRERIEGARANQAAVRDSAEEQQRQALADQAATRGKVATGSAAAVPDRRLLGLGDRIGPRKTDVNQTKLALMREAEQTKTAGGNPSDLAAFRQAHPELALNIDLPALQSAKADLSFSAAPVHGGIMERTAGGLAGPLGAAAMMAAGHGGLPAAAMIGLHQALVNRKAIAGRVLYNPAQKLNPVAIAKALGVSRGVDEADTLGEKVKAAIEAKKELRP